LRENTVIHFGPVFVKFLYGGHLLVFEGLESKYCSKGVVRMSVW